MTPAPRSKAARPPAGSALPSDPWKAAWADVESVLKLHTPAAIQVKIAWNVRNMRADVEAGDGVSLMAAVSQCFGADLQPPDWLKAKFCETVAPLIDGQRKDWREKFGPLLKKGKHPKSHAEALDFAFTVHMEVEKRRKALAAKRKAGTLVTGEATHREICRWVGERLGCGRRRAEDLYRDAKRLLMGATLGPPRKENSGD